MAKYTLFGLLNLLFFLTGITAQVNYTITPLNINTREYDEEAAVYYKGGIVFISNRTQSALSIRVDESWKPLNDIYFARQKENKKYTTPDIFSKNLKSRDQESTICFNKEGNVAYFTKVVDNEHTAIFSAELSGGEWVNITPMRFNLTNYNFSDPCLSPDGKRLFFSSNRPGTLGGSDIFVCTQTRSGWSTPKDLGPTVNSDSSEFYPFLNQNGKLYFASNRKGGIGGVDIYWSMEINGQWTPAKLMEAPFNTKYDDYGYTSDSVDRQGFITSNRSKSYDLFSFISPVPVFDAKPQKINKYGYKFTEESAMNTDTTTYLYEWDFGDGTKHRGRDLVIRHTFPSVGDYLVQLNVIDTLTGEVMMNQSSNIVEVRDEEQPYITMPDTVNIRENFHLDGLKSYLPGKKIISYYWDMGDGTIKTGKETEHQYYYPGTYKIILGIVCQDESSGNQDVFASYKEILVQDKNHSQ